MPAIPLLLNPAANGGRARAVALAAVRHARDRGVELVLHEAKQAGEIERMAAELARDQGDRVLVCGGDGTMHEAVNALAFTDAALGMLPAGRGNDLAGAVGLPEEPLAALEQVLDGVAGRVDLVRVNGRRFGTVAAIGFDADVALRTRTGFWSRGGRLSYVACALSRLFVYEAPWLRIVGDFGVREGRYLISAVSNTGRYGGNVRIAPGSTVDDGTLDICLIRDLPRLRALTLIPRVLQGRHVNDAEVELLRTSWLEVQSEQELPVVADGEPMGATPTRFEIEPGALLVLGRMIT